MSKRVQFSEETSENKKFKYELDYDKELSSVRKHGFIENEIRITAFNMNDERKYGEFQDDEFIFKKRNRSLEADNWLDNLVDDSEFVDRDDSSNHEDCNEQPEKIVIDRQEEAQLYKEISECLKDESETVAKAIKRLRGPKPQKRVFKKRNTTPVESAEIKDKEKTEEIPEDMKQMLHLSELANRAVNEFDEFDIYSQTKSKLHLKVEKAMSLFLENK